MHAPSSTIDATLARFRATVAAERRAATLRTFRRDSLIVSVARDIAAERLLALAGHAAYEPESEVPYE